MARSVAKIYTVQKTIKASSSLLIVRNLRVASVLDEAISGCLSHINILKPLVVSVEFKAFYSSKETRTFSGRFYSSRTRSE